MPSPPRRFRRRLLAVMLVTGLVPLAVLGWVGQQALADLLSVSVAPVEAVLERVSAQAAREGRPTAEVREAQLHLAQAELARRALAARVPWWVAGVVLAAALALARGGAAAGPRPHPAGGAARRGHGGLRARRPHPRPARARRPRATSWTSCCCSSTAWARSCALQRARLTEAPSRWPPGRTWPARWPTS